MALKKTMIRIASAGLFLGGGGIVALGVGLGSGSEETPVVVTASDAALPETAPTPQEASLTPEQDAQPFAQIAPLGLTDAATEIALPILPDTADEVFEALAIPAMPQPIVLAADAPKGNARQLENEFDAECALEISAVAMPAALIAIDVIEPCQPDARVEIVHSGLTVTERSDEAGVLSFDLPAFENPAFITVNMPDGTGQDFLVTVPDFDNFERAAVQWEDNHGLDLHAYEFEAAFGEQGHIWSENTAEPTRAITGEGGFLTQLGSAQVEDPMMAAVYTFPRAAMEGDGAVQLAVEAPITSISCGQTTQARTLETRTDGTVSVVELSFVQPDCDAIGDFVLLQNLFEDLRVASN